MVDVVKQKSSLEDRIVHFIRSKDFRVKKELGMGSCGLTVLLHDEELDEYFVCKKFEPRLGLDRPSLWKNFIRETKILHRLFHENVVRVFNYYIFSEQFAGFIVMEYVDGAELEEYVKENPDHIDDLFQQAIRGFSYLMTQGILHRDIRQSNLLVTSDGTLKIIDFGFGKQIESFDDFDKSISVSGWCKPPKDFSEGRYDYRTEVYFLGRLFRKLLIENDISDFRFNPLIERMCKWDPNDRIESFSAVEKELGNELFTRSRFLDEELRTYRIFADIFSDQIANVSTDIKYIEDSRKILKSLQGMYSGVSLEEYLSNSPVLFNCFLSGGYRYRTGDGYRIETSVVKEFIELFSSVSDEKRTQILANLHTRFDQLQRYADEPIPDDDIPF